MEFEKHQALNKNIQVPAIVGPPFPYYSHTIPIPESLMK